jgi:integrase
MMLIVLRRAFRDAVRDRKMAWNPAEGVRAPKQQRRKITPWSDDEVRTFMEQAREDRLHAVWRLSLLALRPEEVAGLRWDAIDLKVGTLTVARVQVIVAGKVIERGKAAGVRKITFHHARHSTLSYLLNSGQVPIAIVAAWAGHADGGATALKHYIRTRPGDLEAARDAIAEPFGA